MNNQIIPFAFDDALVRVLTDDAGEFLFVAKDVAVALDYVWAGIRNVQHIPEEWRRVESVSTLRRGDQEMLTLTEQGLYFFLARSDKPKALPFQKWLAGEVLPSIRKGGGYGLPAPQGMSDAVKRLRPLLRERVLADTIQSARLTGLNTQEEIDALFLHYCSLIAESAEASRVRLPGMALARDTEDENIRRFADTCLVPCRGHRVNATDLYVAFRSWWRGQGDAALPAQKRFGMVMQEVCPRIRRGGNFWYLHIALKGET